ncbi:MAG TPA: 3-hydroxybutyryl-CoA dehydrogenase [Thermoanaerobaculia bacterium]|nr:3-hydroxybutyryl-CoA dehydrogenase [Thermoanaerobaculia bacterium]
MKINRVGVLGAGLMGSGIAEVCAKAGYETIVREVSDELARKGVGRVESSLAKAVERGKLAAADRDAARGLLTATTRVQDLEKCDLVIEAVVENLPAKKEIFGELDRICGDSAIFCSNTSSLTITELAAATQRPDRFAGLHFFNPVPVMRLVEVVRTIATSDETVAAVSEFAQSLGKQPIFAKDNSGFIVNRLLVPYLLDAVRAVEEGVGSPEDVDKGMELGCGHPMGPLKLLDFVGLDTTYAIAEIMFAEYREKRFAPPPLLKRMVLAGRYGRKSGRGFYEYGS